ncbi:acyl carrier protein [bacterium]|nr:acyl carrier protein [bacterium]
MSLREELLDIIFSVCDVDEFSKDDIDEERPLIGPDSELELDSLDLLEITVVIQKKYGILIKEKNMALKALESLNSFIEFVEKNRK